MEDRKSILIVVEIMRHWSFFKKFFSALGQEKYDITVVTPLSSVYFLALLKCNAVLIHAPWVGAYAGEFSEHDVAAGKLTKDESKKLFLKSFEIFKKLHNNNKISQVWCWNGASSIGEALKTFSRDYGIETKYFELANIKNKIFVDPVGTNARSSLYFFPEKLQYPADMVKYNSWKEEYVNEKINQLTPPQANFFNNMFWLQGGDLLLSLINFIQLPDKVKLFKSLSRKKHAHIKRHAPKLSESNYVFLPLQVSTDTQLTINSEVDNFQAILEAEKIKSRYSADLFIKLHPAEKDFNYLMKLYGFIRERGHLLVENNTFELVMYSKEVVVINSTVGFEGLVAGKKVTFLGKTFYEKIKTAERLANYVNDYLIDIDYFSKNMYCREKVKKILSKSDRD